MSRRLMRSLPSWLVSCACVLLAVPAEGQSLTSDWTALSPSRRMVYVTTDAGAEASGQLIRVDAASLTILNDRQERRFERTDIIAVDRRGDSIRNGAMIGALTGAGLGALAGLMSDCGFPGPSRSCTAGETARFMAVMSGVSAGVGVGIDALVRGRTRIYSRTSPGGPVATRLIPIVGRRAAGAALSVSWP